MTNDGKSANGCLPSTHPLAAASEGPRSKQRDNGRTICLLDSKQAARTLEGQKEGDESNCYKSQSSYLIKIFFTFEARRAARYPSDFFICDHCYKFSKFSISL